MSAASSLSSHSRRAVLGPWGVVLAGLLALYLPSFIDLFRGPWGTEKNAHGPIVMAVAFAFLYFRVRQLLSHGMIDVRAQPLVGIPVFAFGLLCYALGRSQGVLLLEVGSLIPVLGGIVTTVFGLRAWSRMWFAFFFMLFMIPLPSSIVDMVTLPMKIAVSFAAEHLLYWVGYPIARSGVMLSIGQYQLLVADACAGLNSLFTLEAMGLLYMNLVRRPSVLRNVVLASLIVPISFTANTIRIVCLALITYHLGDAAGQGFLHGFSGLVLFLTALMLIVGVDGLLTRLVKPRMAVASAMVQAESATQAAANVRRVPTIAGRTSIALFLGMLLAPALAQALMPKLQPNEGIARLADSVPQHFGEWTALPDADLQAQLSVADDGGKTQEQPYDDILMRTYVNSVGDRVMLAIAYTREQRQDVKLHLPEVCYPAQGYKVLSLKPTTLSLAQDTPAIPAKRMLASNDGRMEAVTYWTRIGDGYPQGGLAMRMKIFRDGLHGRTSDGMLVRASMLVHGGDVSEAYSKQVRFLRQLALFDGKRGNPLVAGSVRER